MKESGLPREPATDQEARDAVTTSQTHFTQLDATNSQAAADEPLPSVIGRYRVEKLLGRGGFGFVVLAHDDELQRKVAIKIPHRARFLEPGTADSYLAEARAVAGLDHPGIVPVYDVGVTADGLPFVVSKYVEGGDLAERMKGEPLPPAEAAALVASVAEALHFAHGKGIVHRDMKPGNILLDGRGQPLLGDFGLALREEDFGKGFGYAGTPCYMSPEQARGEGHRVDGRSDVFSLGIIFYELLTGRRPFRSDSTAELLDHIVQVEPRPPRQINDAIPLEYERICLKALAKKPTERYTTAKDLGEDLRRLSEPSLALVQAAPPTARNSREAKLESGVQVGNLGCSLRVAITLVVLIVFTASSQYAWLSSNARDPVVALRKSIDAEDIPAAERMLAELKGKSPARYLGPEIQKLVAETERIKIRMAVRDEAFHTVQLALAQGTPDQLKKARLAIDDSVLELLNEGERRELSELLNQVVAAIQRHQDARDAEFRREFIALAQASQASEVMSYDQLTALSKRIRDLDAMEGISTSVKQEIDPQLSTLVNSLAEPKRLALRESLAIERITRAVGRTDDYVAALEDYVASFPNRPRALAFKASLTEHRRSWEVVDQFNQLIASINAVELARMDLKQSRELAANLSLVSTTFKDLVPPEVNDLRPFTLSERHRPTAVARLVEYLSDPVIFDLQAVVRSAGDRYYFEGEPRPSRQAEGELEFMTYLDLARDSTRIVSLATGDIRNFKLANGSYDWRSPQARFAQAALNKIQVSSALVLPSGEWDRTFQNLLSLLFHETQMEPVLKIEIAQSLLSAGSSGSYAFERAYALAREQRLEKPWIEPANWIDPSDVEGGGRRRAALNVLPDLEKSIVEGANRIITEYERSSDRQTTSRYIAVGWLRRDQRDEWLASVSNLKTTAANDRLLYVLISTKDGIERHLVATIHHGQVELNDETKELWTEGLLLYAVEKT